ncbi:MAG: M48 family metalloprotease [Chloroflexi bacterium]|nr:M48 family metalloprotease [Chloroflexota bacterium]
MIELAQDIASFVVIESAIESALLWLMVVVFLRLFRVSSPPIRQIAFSLPLLLPVMLVTVFHVLDPALPFPLERSGPLDVLIFESLVLPLPLAVVFSVAGVVGICASLSVLVRQCVLWGRACAAWRSQQREQSYLRLRCSAMLDALATAFECRAPRLVIMEGGSAGSLALGWCSYIFVPQTLAARLDDEELRALLAHELGHTIRRDGLLDFLAKVCRNLMLFNPLAHMALSKFDVEREMATDDLVARDRRSRLALASCLLKGYRFQTRRAWVPVTSLIGGRSALARRVRRLVYEAAPQPPSTFAWVTVAALTGLSGVALAALA